MNTPAFRSPPLQGLLLALALAGLAAPAGAAPRPAPIGPVLQQPSRLDLRVAEDARVQAALSASLKKLALERAVQEGRLAAALVDITDPQHPRMAQVNGHRMMYAASLPKIAILLGAFQKAAEDKLVLDEAALSELRQMIRHSSNSAASLMLQRVGTDYLARTLQSQRYRLYDPALNGGLWVGKPYGAGRAVRRDPLHNLSHGATAYQVARFYYLMETGQLVSPEASQQMKEIMSAPAIHHKFVKGLAQAHPDAQLYRKSGTWRSFHADSAIVERDGRRYIAVGLADDPRGGDWMRDLIVAMDAIVFSSAPRPAQPQPPLQHPVRPPAAAARSAPPAPPT